MRTKINLPVRLKNWPFWLGLFSTILAAMGVRPETFTDWSLVWAAVVALFKNPFQLGCVIFAIVGVLVDPTTKGLGDSDRALSYDKPQ